eukprot:CAMPEP_0119328520 /NCGR_PEP_ID=MMETSP1333-20130426/73532_1 /TAXON_ID=418940 /ORGANISM="Scyphosphaera apsteinii, Strain RCC1455" /LENGTH=309 /DNA_ID=CAMNT_0007337399 /DNA_START=234 /DNA_END=1163 /DNA_ORIENTATION=+
MMYLDPIKISCPRNETQRQDPGGCYPQRHNIASRIVKHMEHLEGLHERAAHLKHSFANASPFPHVHTDNLFPEDVLHLLRKEFPEPTGTLFDGSLLQCAWAAIRGWRCIRKRGAGFLKIQNSNERTMGPNLQGVITAMKSHPFITFLEYLTGIAPLFVDDTNEGSGQHQILRGGSLQIHADFNMIRANAGLYRRVNVFLYLNHDWDEAWGGDLELWDRSMSTCAARIRPLNNRLVVFSTTDFSYHGHADPLLCPVYRSRRSIAMYYYTTQPAALADRLTDSDGNLVPHSTLYQDRKCESCLNAQCRAHG